MDHLITYRAATPAQLAQARLDALWCRCGACFVCYVRDLEAAKRAAYKVDPRIAAYVAELEAPGVPIISTSHMTLRRLYSEHGQDTIDALLADHWRHA